YFARYGELDIGLDPFPYNGHTSTLDSLWMGVPVVTLTGQTAVGRGGVSILENVGLPNLIAQDPEEYIEIAADLAGNLPRLSSLRASLRDQMCRSALVDLKGFTANVEAAFRQMWTNWCAR